MAQSAEIDRAAARAVVAGARGSGPRRLAIFEDRYGEGSLERLLALLQQPCVTFAQIAGRFGVTRERVRQWHRLLLPAAPTGRERRRLCAVHQQKRRLLADPVFGAFYRQVRRHFEADRITAMRAHAGFRTRLVRLDGRLIAIRLARDLVAAPDDLAGGPAYRLGRYRGRAELIYFQLNAQDFLLLPAVALPRAGTTFVDGASQRYQPFKNTFRALRGQWGRPLSQPSSDGRSRVSNANGR